MREHVSAVATASLLLLACGGSSPAPQSPPSAELGAVDKSADSSPTSASPQTPSSEAATSPDAGRATSTAWPFGPPMSDDDKAAQLARLEKDPGPAKSNWVPPGKSARYGHAEALVAAPFDVVRARFADFAHYKDLAGPKFKQVSVVDKQAGLTDVYFKLPIMKGLVTIWYVARFSPPRTAEGVGDVVEGTFVKGNINGMNVAFTMRSAGDKGTIVGCDLLLSLAIPAPQSNVDEELRDACGDVVKAVRAKTTPSP